MTTARNIRPERALEAFSRGSELVRDIRAMWRLNKGATNAEIADRISFLRLKYDLTLAEWHHWCEQSSV